MAKNVKIVADPISCGHCKFFQSDTPSNEAGFCFYYPPTVLIREDGEIESERPTVTRSEFCGKFLRITQ